jgi:putative mRNA 3-end processing factor
MVPLTRWSGGVHIQGTRLWCDAARANGVTFVSGADVALRGRWERLLTTERTQQLAKLDGVLPATFGRPFAMGRARIELLPAGRLPGSAQLRAEVDGRVVLYAGAVNPMGGRLAEPAQLRGCDELIVAAPLAAAGLALPPRAEVEAQLVEAVRSVLSVGEVPLILAPALGLAAEVVALLAAAGVPMRVPARLGALLASYAKLGVPAPARVPRLNARAVPVEEAVVWPLNAPPPPKLDRARVLAVGPRERFPLADSCDLPALLDFAAACDARQVYLLNGYQDDVARAFARKKLRLSPLGPPQQQPLFS